MDTGFCTPGWVPGPLRHLVCLGTPNSSPHCQIIEQTHPSYTLLGGPWHPLPHLSTQAREERHALRAAMLGATGCPPYGLCNSTSSANHLDDTCYLRHCLLLPTSPGLLDLTILLPFTSWHFALQAFLQQHLFSPLHYGSRRNSLLIICNLHCNIYLSLLTSLNTLTFLYYTYEHGRVPQLRRDIASTINIRQVMGRPHMPPSQAHCFASHPAILWDSSFLLLGFIRRCLACAAHLAEDSCSISTRTAPYLRYRYYTSAPSCRTHAYSHYLPAP